MSTDRFTEILNYLSAMSRDIGELRSEMRGRFDETDAKLTKLEDQLTEVRSDIRHLARKVELLNQDSLDLRADAREMEVRVGALERKQA